MLRFSIGPGSRHYCHQGSGTVVFQIDSVLAGSDDDGVLGLDEFFLDQGVQAIYLGFKRLDEKVGHVVNESAER